MSRLLAALLRHSRIGLEMRAAAEDFDMAKWVSEDDKLAAAFTFGALQALKVAAGVKDINLEV